EEIENTARFEKADNDKIAVNIEILEKELNMIVEDRTSLQQKMETVTSLIQNITSEESELKASIELEDQNITKLQEKSADDRRLYFEIRSQTELLQEKINNLTHQLSSFKQRKEAIKAKIENLSQDNLNSEKEKEKLKVDIHKHSEKIRNKRTAIKEKEGFLVIAESKLNDLQQELKELDNRIDRSKGTSEERKEQRVAWEIKKAERDRDLVNLEESCWQELKKSLDEVKEEISLDELGDTDITASLNEADSALQRIGSVNLMAEEEHQIQAQRYEFLLQEQEDLRQSITSTREAIKKIDQESKSQFLTALEEVNKNFQDVFAILFEGGKAEVKLSDPDSPLESGVDIIAQPPGKRVQSLTLLSGGEKTLTSLAFFFALFRYKPTPFCILDEVDAALDEVNLGRFLNMMKKIKEQTQFIIVTHNFKTMEVADYIYGTTMAEPSITSIYSVKIDMDTKTLTRTETI
ncbi:chromosome segregation protein SMC, partial [Acidobacteriota bacterium]